MSDYVDTVDIEGVQYDIQDTATKTTADQNKQDIEAMKESADYSTTEHLTGRKWIDGRPTYEKTFLVYSNTRTPHSITNISEICKITAVTKKVITTEGQWRQVAFAYHGGLQWCASFVVTDIDIVLQAGSEFADRHVNGAYITLEYTKTTDTPQP